MTGKGAQVQVMEEHATHTDRSTVKKCSVMTFSLSWAALLHKVLKAVHLHKLYKPYS
jgi:hypothetical protein